MAGTVPKRTRTRPLRRSEVLTGSAAAATTAGLAGTAEAARQGVTLTCGVGGTYSDINAAVAAAQANPAIVAGGKAQQDITWAVKAGGVISPIKQSIGGIAANGHALLLTAAPGEGFRDHPHALTNPLQFNEKHGAFVRSTVNTYDSGVELLADVTVFGLQFAKFSAAAPIPPNAVVAVNTPTPHALVWDSNIVFQRARSHKAPGLYIEHGGTIRNSLFYGSDPNDVLCVYIVDGVSKMQFCTLASMTLSTSYQGAGVTFGYSNPGEVINTIAAQFNNRNQHAEGPAFEFSGIPGRQGNSDYNLTTNPTIVKAQFDTAHCQHDAAVAVEFYATGTGSIDPEAADWRLRPGSLKARGHAAPLAAVTLDILGQKRSATAPCIGCYELPAAGK